MKYIQFFFLLATIFSCSNNKCNISKPKLEGCWYFYSYDNYCEFYYYDDVFLFFIEELGLTSRNGLEIDQNSCTIYFMMGGERGVGFRIEQINNDIIKAIALQDNSTVIFRRMAMAEESMELIIKGKNEFWYDYKNRFHDRAMDFYRKLDKEKSENISK